MEDLLVKVKRWIRENPESNVEPYIKVVFDYVEQIQHQNMPIIGITKSDENIDHKDLRINIFLMTDSNGAIGKFKLGI